MYTRNPTWVDNTNPPGQTPSAGATTVLAALLNHLEDGVVAVSEEADGAATAADLQAEITRAEAAEAQLQPLDADLTAIAALATTAYGRGFLTIANQAALLAAVGNIPESQVLNLTSDLTLLNAPAHILLPSGDASGVTDAAAINAALVTYGKVLLAAGQWYVTNIGMVTNNRWLQGCGQATIINGPAGGSAITVTGAGEIKVSDLGFGIGAGGYAFTVNGCYDSNFTDLFMTGSTAAGGVKINGDLAMEQNWTNIAGRTVGGVGFDIERTTSTYTGSLYMMNVRFVTPPAGAYGFRANSSAGSPSLNMFSAVDCVFDNYAEDAWSINNCAQVFMTGCWGAISGTAAAGSVPMRITGGNQIVINNQYVYSGLTNGICLLVAGAPTGISLDNIIFDGGSSNTALGLATATPGGVNLGKYQAYGNMKICDVPGFLPLPATVTGSTSAVGQETQSRAMVGTNAITLTSGLKVFTYFTAAKTEFWGHVEMMTGTAQSGGTYCGIGLFTVSPAGLLTLVAKGEQTSSPSLWNVAFQYVGGLSQRIAFSSSYQAQAGTQYALCALFVGTTAPQVAGTLLSAGAGGLAVANTPLGMISAQLAAQSTMGTVGTTTHTQASLASCSYQPYFVTEA